MKSNCFIIMIYIWWWWQLVTWWHDSKDCSIGSDDDNDGVSPFKGRTYLRVSLYRKGHFIAYTRSNISPAEKCFESKQKFDCGMSSDVWHTTVIQDPWQEMNTYYATLLKYGCVKHVWGNSGREHKNAPSHIFSPKKLNQEEQKRTLATIW